MDPLAKLKVNYDAGVIKTDKICDTHDVNYITIKITGLTVCPECYKEDRDKEHQKQVSEQYRREQEAKRLYHLRNLSMMDDDLENATFDNFESTTKEQKADLEAVKAQARGLLKGESCNVVLVGDTGVGKSHLAYSALKAISDHTKELAVFVNVVNLLSTIREDLSLESFYIQRLIDVDWLVLDDIGTEKTTEWSSGILYSILNGRSKTIITTNLEPSDVLDRYGKRIYSRVFKGTGLTKKGNGQHVYHFKNREDERLKA